jgi:S1-C subfamily serine protease
MRRLLLSLLTSAVLGAATVILFLPTPKAVFLSARANRYEVAQAKTVLIETPTGYGTGVVIHRGNKTFVWTAKHVVRGSDTVKVVRLLHFQGRKAGKLEFPARILSRLPNTDSALLQVDAPRDAFVGATWAGETPKLGATLYHVGNFYGPAFDGSFSIGHLSQVGVEVKDQDPTWPWGILDQGDFAMVSGSSGGPVFNANDEVVGLIVGGPTAGKDRISCYEPFREIRADALKAGVVWAIDEFIIGEYEYYVPSDELLDKLAQTAKLPVVTNDIPTIVVIKPTAPKKALPSKH